MNHQSRSDGQTDRSNWSDGSDSQTQRASENRNSDNYDDLVIECLEDELQIRVLEEQEDNYGILSETELEEITKIEDESFKRIVFIKTHKTGSSTIQNIFYRYASGSLIFLY